MQPWMSRHGAESVFVFLLLLDTAARCLLVFVLDRLTAAVEKVQSAVKILI